MLTRRQTAGACVAPFLRAADARPNTVFILVDDLRFDALGCLGHPWLKTPHLDRLAREGAICTNAFVATPLRSLSRGSFLTGRWVHAHGIVDNTDRAAQSHRLFTFPMAQQTAGYETAYVGKWHMGNDSSPRPGFDRWVSFPGQGRYVDPPINVDGKLEPHTGFVTGILTRYAVEFLRQPHAKPFSLYLAHKAVHGPFTPPERHKDLYAGGATPRHPNAAGDYSGKPALRRNPGQGRGPADEVVRNQLRLLQAVDEGVGELLKALQETGQLDSTLIIFTSDNGYFHGDHPKWIRPGSKITADILNVDIAPTLMEMAGAAIPPEVKGKSLVPVLRGKAKQVREDFYAEYVEEKNFPRIPSWPAVRTRAWKLVEYKDHPEWAELYHMKTDPYEMKNLAGEAGARKRRDKLAARLAVLQRETA